MELTTKLKGIPSFYYFNSDDNDQNDDHMRRNLNSLNVENYKRISTSKYTKDNINDWKDLLLDRSNYKLPVATAAYSITILETLKDWYNNTEEDSLIISRDFIDFGLVKYWPFDWEYMIKRLPYDWDCFLLGFESTTQIPFYLHQIIPGHNFLVAMLNRRYVKKLIRLHCIEDKYKLVNKISDKNFGGHSGTPDYFIGHCGKTYCLPLFPTHTDYIKKETKKYAISKTCRLAYYGWWRTDEDFAITGEVNRHSMDELFTYGKANDYGMIKKIPTQKILQGIGKR